MNTNGGGPSSAVGGGAGPGTSLYAGAEPSIQMLPMLGTSAMVPIAYYPTVNKDQVDWGALAQQWIQMREQWSQPVAAGTAAAAAGTTADFIPSPPPPPSFSEGSDTYPEPGNETVLLYSTTQQQAMAPSEYDEEQGEAPMEVEKEDDHPAGSPFLLAQGEPAGALSRWGETKENHHQQHLLQHQMELGSSEPGNQRVPARIDGTTLPPADSAKQPPLLHGQIGRDIKGFASVVVPPPPMLNGPKKTSCYPGTTVTTLTEAKRKLLPAWIHEGLEKMEREKQRQLERELERKFWEEEQMKLRDVGADPTGKWGSISPSAVEKSPARSNMESEQAHRAPSPSSGSPVVAGAPAASETGHAVSELREKLLSTSVRRILTEILMDVTGELMGFIAKQTVAKVNRRKAKLVQPAQVKTGLATCIGGLGLVIYGDSDEEDEEDEESDEQQQHPHRQQERGEAKGQRKRPGASDSAADNSTDGELSDSEVLRRLKDKIDYKQDQFVAVAQQIEQWIACAYQPPAEPKPQLFRRPERDMRAHYSNEDDQPVGSSDEDDNGADDGGDDGARLLTHHHAGAGELGGPKPPFRDSGPVKNGCSSTRDGETQPVNDKLNASQHSAGRSRRRDKRVSRFSVVLNSPAAPPTILPVVTFKKVNSSQAVAAVAARAKLVDSQQHHHHPVDLGPPRQQTAGAGSGAPVDIYSALSKRLAYVGNVAVDEQAALRGTTDEVKKSEPASKSEPVEESRAESSDRRRSSSSKSSHRKHHRRDHHRRQHRSHSKSSRSRSPSTHSGARSNRSSRSSRSRSRSANRTQWSAGTGSGTTTASRSSRHGPSESTGITAGSSSSSSSSRQRRRHRTERYERSRRHGRHSRSRTHSRSQSRSRSRSRSSGRYHSSSSSWKSFPRRRN